MSLDRTLCPQRTRLRSAHPRQQVSISHGSWSLGPGHIPRYFRAIDRLIKTIWVKFPMTDETVEEGRLETSTECGKVAHSEGVDSMHSIVR